MSASGNITRKPIRRIRTTARGVVMSSAFGLSIISHAAAIAVGAVAATAYLTVDTASPQSLAAYVSAICAKSFGSASSAEAPYLAESVFLFDPAFTTKHHPSGTVMSLACWSTLVG